MLNSLITIDDLLNAKEGEHYQFKEAKRRFDSDEATQICCALANCGGGMLVLGTPARSSAVRRLTSLSVHEKG